MYRDQYHPQVRKDLKKLDKKLRQDIELIHLPSLLEQPEQGAELTGDLSGIQAYHFISHNQSCRIAYLVDEQEGMVFVLMIAKRENFYTVLKRRM